MRNQACAITGSAAMKCAKFSGMSFVARLSSTSGISICTMIPAASVAIRLMFALSSKPIRASLSRLSNGSIQNNSIMDTPISTSMKNDRIIIVSAIPLASYISKIRRTAQSSQLILSGRCPSNRTLNIKRQLILKKLDLPVAKAKRRMPIRMPDIVQCTIRTGSSRSSCSRLPQTTSKFALRRSVLPSCCNADIWEHCLSLRQA
mmetsp:Transcript_82761/g.151847  ORF Transcript_82761/g.151847 Transcript_82761/m.151847 type:complete len:204 (-) Transcript_82761:169-780(-)